MYGPELPPEETQGTSNQPLGPELPPGFLKRSADKDGDDVGSAWGPELPPDMKKAKIYGPTIGPIHPPNLADEQSDDSSASGRDESECDDDVIGPRPVNYEVASCYTSVAEKIEKRAQNMKAKLSAKPEDKPKQRESWMTQVPERLGSSLAMPVAKTRLGDGHDVIDSRLWTETPAEREQRELGLIKDPDVNNQKEQFIQQLQSSRDQQLAATIDEFNKESNREKSLLDIHREKFKKKKKKNKKDSKEKNKREKKKHKKAKKETKDGDDETTLPERRPFDRDKDLRVNVMDEAQKSMYLKRVQNLTSRFGHGKQQFM